jgi:hypothetical protein
LIELSDCHRFLFDDDRDRWRMFRFFLTDTSGIKKKKKKKNKEKKKTG